MATSETLRPTASLEADATLTNGANAYDGDTGTNAVLTEATEDQQATAVWDGFPSGAIATNRRASVILEIFADWDTTDANDTARVWVRTNALDPWTEIDAQSYPNGWAGAYRSFDITDVLGTRDVADLEVQVGFRNNGTVGGGGSKPLPDLNDDPGA